MAPFECKSRKLNAWLCYKGLTPSDFRRRRHRQTRSSDFSPCFGATQRRSRPAVFVGDHARSRRSGSAGCGHGGNLASRPMCVADGRGDAVIEDLGDLLTLLGLGTKQHSLTSGFHLVHPRSRDSKRLPPWLRTPGRSSNCDQTNRIQSGPSNLPLALVIALCGCRYVPFLGGGISPMILFISPDN